MTLWIRMSLFDWKLDVLVVPVCKYVWNVFPLIGNFLGVRRCLCSFFFSILFLRWTITEPWLSTNIFVLKIKLSKSWVSNALQNKLITRGPKVWHVCDANGTNIGSQDRMLKQTFTYTRTDFFEPPPNKWRKWHQYWQPVSHAWRLFSLIYKARVVQKISQNGYLF